MLPAIRAPDTPLNWAVKDPDCTLTLRPSLRLMLLVFGYFTWNPTLPTCWLKKRKEKQVERRVKQKLPIFIFTCFCDLLHQLTKMWKFLDIALCVCTGSLQPLSCICHRKERKRKSKKKTMPHIKESFEKCQWTNIPATATKALPLCVRTSHASRLSLVSYTSPSLPPVLNSDCWSEAASGDWSDWSVIFAL